MANNKAVRLGADQEAVGHRRVARVENGALSFDNIPVVRRCVGRQRFSRAAEEIRDYGIHGKAAPSNHDAGLAGSAKINRRTPAPHINFKLQRRVFLTDGAVGTNRQNTTPSPFSSRAHRQVWRRNPHVDKTSARRLRCTNEFFDVGKWSVQSRNNVDAVASRAGERRDPVRRKSAANARCSDQDGSRTDGRYGFRLHILQTKIDGISRKTHLPDTKLRSPMYQAKGRLCERRPGLPTNEQNVGCAYFHHERI